MPRPKVNVYVSHDRAPVVKGAKCDYCPEADCYFIDVDELINGRISEKLPPLESLTLKERTLLHAYRNNPGMQSALDKLLGIEDGGDIAEDMENTVKATLAKSTTSK